MEEWDLDTEENSCEGITVPIFNFEFTNVGRKLFSEPSEDEVPSDEEALQDLSSLEFPKIEIKPEVLSTLSCSTSEEIFLYTLHLMVFRGDYKSINHYWKHSYLDYKALVNLIDLRGNSPLMLAAKLLSSDKIYEKIFKFLLFHEADHSVKDACGWSVMDEIVIQKNQVACSALFDHMYREKLEKWKRNKHIILQALSRLPNFYVEINWEFSSSVIPLVSRLAPHDICKLTKFENRFKIDTSLVGWKNLRSKRRQMSFFFQPIQDGNIYDEIFVTNHHKKVTVKTFEPLDPEEKAAVVNDILMTEPMQGDASILSYKLKPCLNWRGKQSTCRVGAWDTCKHKVSYKGQVKYKKKVKNMGQCSSSRYFDEQVSKDQDNLQVFSYSSNKEPTKTLIKKSKAFVWLSKDFPFTLQEFLPVLQITAEGNSTMKKLYNFLSDQNLLAQIGPDSFPVKIDIPLTLSVKAVVTFDKFRVISDPSGMKVPDYPHEPRKTAQKILTCPKKRILLANLVI